MSERIPVGRRFATELDRALADRRVGVRDLAAQLGISRTAVRYWRNGSSLPRLDLAIRLADALEWPTLASIVRMARTRDCDRCGAPFVSETHAFARFCSPVCREVDLDLRRPGQGATLAASLDALLAANELSRSGLEEALAVYRAADRNRIRRADKQTSLVSELRGAVAAMCDSCEPDGYCRTPSCALREVSPFGLETAERPGVLPPTVPPWERADYRERNLVVLAAGRERRWAQVDARERNAARVRDFHASMSDGQRTAHAARISAGRRRASGKDERAA